MLTDYNAIDRLIDYLKEYIKDEDQTYFFDPWEQGHVAGLKDALATAEAYRERFQ